MTTLAIIGSGIAGRSLLYNLTTENLSFDNIILFESDDFALPCALHSTAIVAPRGVSRGHSDLGDLIMDGYEAFAMHVKEAAPAGVSEIRQYTGELTKLSQFKLRYPEGHMTSSLNGIGLKEEIYFAQEDAFMIDPAAYLEWLLNQSEKKLTMVRVKEFVTEVIPEERVKIATQGGRSFEADHVVFATGASSRFWKNLFPESKLSTSVPSQGAYLEFKDVNWGMDSFSITLDGYNLIYRKDSLTLLIGSTTHDHQHVMAPVGELKSIYLFMQQKLKLDLPGFDMGKVLVGQREKAQKRMPYVLTSGNIFFIGGLYKNGFTLSLKMTRNLARQLPQSS
ncbi:MAG TPA: FAD-dependent oxidoreductase [Bacteriovoracaceae bacterium]|nr:FAD-dependent oxidoreductase [Bacteriovoracaceae bacterium]